MYMCILHYFNYYLPDFPLPFIRGSSLVFRFWIFVLISLNAITKQLWNLHFWPEIKPRVFGVGADSKTLDYQRANPDSESEVAQSCPTLCDPMDCSPPGSSIHGTLQARVLEWVAIAFSRRCSQPRDWTQVSRIVGRHFTVWASNSENSHKGNHLKRRPGITQPPVAPCAGASSKQQTKQK